MIFQQYRPTYVTSRTFSDGWGELGDSAGVLLCLNTNSDLPDDDPLGLLTKFGKSCCKIITYPEYKDVKTDGR